MSEWNNDDDAALDAEITRLRNALGELRVPADEEALRAAFRARPAVTAAEPYVAVSGSRHRSDTRGSGVSRRRSAIFAAGALAASFAIAAVMLVGLDRTDSDVAESAATTTVSSGEAVARAGASSGERDLTTTVAFQPLLYSPGISPAQSYNIVRVRIPLTSLVGYDAPLDGMIEADVLVGEDGLATGIRFDTANAPLVSMASH